jgi:hypothetical protein
MDQATHASEPDGHEEDESLREYLARAGKVPAMQGLALALQLLAWLDVCHRRGLVHGDVRPEQIRVTRAGRLRMVRPLSEPGEPPQPAGGEYSAPELLLGQPPSHPADLYAASIVSYELLTGTTPFRADPSSPQPAFPPSAARPGLPPALDAFFRRALAQEPQHRFATAEDMSSAMQAAMGLPIWDRKQLVTRPAFTAAPVRARPTAPAEVHTSRTHHARGHRRRAGAALAAGLAAVVALSWLWPAGQEPDRAAVQPQVAQTHATREPAARAPVEPERATPVPATIVQPDPVQAAPLTLPTPTVPVQAALDPDREQVVTQRMGAAPAQPRVAPAVAQSPVAGPAEDAARAAPVRHAYADPQAGQRQREARVTVPRRAVVHASTGPQCGDRTSLPGELCSAVQCMRHDLRNHPLCVRMHAEARTRHVLAEPREGP